MVVLTGESVASIAPARIAKTHVYRFLSVFSLMSALFGGYIWTLFDLPDDPWNIALDTLMICITLFFVVEVFICWFGQTSYPWSFFFFMDVLGTLSMVFEISFILGTAGKMNNVDQAVDAVLMRSARAAKLAARAGRLVKLTKLLQFWGVKNREDDGDNQGHQADTISKKLMHVLSTKVSMLTIVLVLVVPLFSIGTFPESDLSMEGWADRLEATYTLAAKKAALNSTSHSTIEFQRVCEKMDKFYKDRTYNPYLIEGFSDKVVVNGKNVFIPGASLVSREVPNRKQNIFRQRILRCELPRPECSDAALYFNFDEPGQLAAGMESAMILFVILVMAFTSYDVSQTVDVMVVRPIEAMLGTLRQHASRFLNAFERQTGGAEDDGLAEELDEIALLQMIFQKLAKLTGIMTASNVVDEQDMEGMGQEQKGVIVDMMGLGSTKSVAIDKNSSDAAVQRLVPSVGVADPVINSWELDFLPLTIDVRNNVAHYIFFDSPLGTQTSRKFTDFEVFKRFYATVLEGYNDCPYHNATHACDVLHTVYRLMSLSRCDQWVPGVDIFALLVAAIGHDVGHQGKTNPFLVETRHELAITFNDSSPLENLHASTLFRICTQQNKNVFEKMSADDYKEARKVCVKAILHTDLAQHFDMVKEIKKVYEVSTEVIEQQVSRPTALVEGSSESLDKDYEADVLQKNSLLFLEMFLHLADVSNPLKPFTICQAWAWRVLDEFFDQGDEEKRLGIPVGMLNNRDSVNRPGSQHGFITFLVAPLAFGVVNLLPQLNQLSTQMASNLEQWRNLWVEDAKPDQEAIAKKDADVQKMKEQALAAQQRLQL